MRRLRTTLRSHTLEPGHRIAASTRGNMCCCGRMLYAAVLMSDSSAQVLRIADVKDADLEVKLAELEATRAALARHADLAAERDTAAAAAAELRARVAAQKGLEATVASVRALPEGCTSASLRCLAVAQSTSKLWDLVLRSVR